MTKLFELLAEENISIYKLAKELGKNPVSYSTRLKEKITGQRPLSPEEAGDIFFIIEKILEKPINRSSFIGESKNLFLK